MFDAGQESRPRPTRIGDISHWEINKFATCKQRYNWIRNRREKVFNRRSPSDAQGRKSWWTKILDDANDVKLRRLVNGLDAPDSRLILCAKNIGSCMTIQGTTVTGTVLAATEFCEFLFARYDVTPHNLKKCHGCNQSLYIHHILSCSKGGLIMPCHNKVRDNILYLAWQAFPYNCIHGEPLIHQGCFRSEEELCHGRGGLETRGDIIIQELIHRFVLIYVCVHVYTYAIYDGVSLDFS